MSCTRGTPTTNRRAGPTAMATFMASVTALPPGVVTDPTRAMAACIASRTGGGAAPVVAVDPAGDRIAREVDDVAAEPIELGDDRSDDLTQDRGQDLGASLRAELRGEGLGQRGEPGDIGEQPGSANAVRHPGAAREGTATVPRDVGLGIVEGGRVRSRDLFVDHARILARRRAPCRRRRPISPWRS